MSRLSRSSTILAPEGGAQVRDRPAHLALGHAGLPSQSHGLGRLRASDIPVIQRGGGPNRHSNSPLDGSRDRVGEDPQQRDPP